MYARVSRRQFGGKSYDYLQLCEAYRNDKGQPRTRVLANFGRIDHLDRAKVDSVINGLLKYSSFPEGPRVSELDHGRVMDYGDILTVVHLWARLKISEAIAAHLKDVKAEFDVAGMIQVMVLNRISDPLSKLGVLRWLQTVYIPELKSGSVQYQHLLRAMDYLLSIKDELEQDLYNELVTLFSPEVDLVYYDLTSTYFEGEGPELAAHGYSRDHRPDRKQIVLALVVTKEGLPIYHEVLPGNTADVSTLQATAQTLATRYRLGRVIMVCDRGMISTDNVEKLEELGLPFIIALRPRNNEEAQALYQKTLAGFTPVPELGELIIKETKKEGYRYIQCHNPNVAKETKRNREERFKKAAAEVTKLEKRFKNGSVSERDLYHKVQSLLEERGLSRFFEPRIEGDTIILYRPEEIWEQENYLAGKFFLKTSLDADRFPSAEVVKSYKQLQTVENAFRELKDFLKIRPVFHYTDERVRAHVFICVLAYLFERLIELRCRRASLRHTGRRALELLSRLKAIECQIGERRVVLSNRVEEETRRILEAMDIPIPEKIVGNQ